jgi:integrase
MPQDPPYIPETKEFLQLRQFVGQDVIEKGSQKGHVDLSLALLSSVLHKMYKETSVSRLVTGSKTVNEATRFSEAMYAEIKQLRWSKSTAQMIISTVKKLLRVTAVDNDFIESLRYLCPKKKRDPILGKRYSNLPEDSPIGTLLSTWVESIKSNTRNRSDLSVRNIMTFLLKKCIPAIGLDLNSWPEDATTLINAKLSAPDFVRELCGQDGNAKKKFAWLRIFCDHMVICKPTMKLEWIVISTASANATQMFDDGSDHHRISADDLQKIKQEAEKDTKTDLMYMLLITTGMRIGGLCRIKIEHIATVMTKDVHVKEAGRTLEKGNKWFTFIMSPEVRHLVNMWITKKRPADPSPYLFPGQAGASGHLTTATVRGMFGKLFRKIGLQGQEFHPHALRHSYAHILLESGNSVDQVSKLLNHSSVAVTEKFYLRESAAQVAERANIPWLPNSKKREREVVPAFLSDNTPNADRQGNKSARKKRRNRIMENLSRIADA